MIYTQAINEEEVAKREAVPMELLRSVQASGNFVVTGNPAQVCAFLSHVIETNPDNGAKGIYDRQVLGFKPSERWVGIEVKTCRGRAWTTREYGGAL